MTHTAFDRYAADYDSVAESALGQELRRRVRAVVEPLLVSDRVVVDLGCGSGLDAEWLAPRAGSVRAFDISPEMVKLAQQRCRDLDLDSVRVEQADAATVTLDADADLVLANFGVVNCVGDLGQFGVRLASMLAPGGHAVVVTMTKWCPVELAVGACTLNRSLMMRRFGTASYHGTPLHYASARQLASHFGTGLQLVDSEALGVALPPLEQRGWFEDRPRLLRCAARMDRTMGAVAARVGLGDHHIAVFKKRP